MVASSDPPWLAFVPPTFTLHRVDLAEPAVDITIADTVTMFLDVAGFTPLTAALEAHGSAGLEELQNLLNSFFGRVDRTIKSWGGTVVRYEGDAVVAMFDRQPRLEGALGAAGQILDIADDMAAVETLAGLQGIRAKIGIASGPLRSLLLEHGDRRGIVVAGLALDAAVDAEHHATPGDVIASQTVWPGLPDMETELIEPGTTQAQHRRLALPDPRPTPRDVDTDPRVGAEQVVDPRTVLDDIVIERVTRGLATTDFRVVGSLFVGLDDIDHLTDLIPATRTMSRIVLDAGGAVLSVASGDKGHKALISVGAPAAIDEIEARVLTIADALLNEPSLKLRIGATTATNLAGKLGGSVRADYTLLGNGVNMAARLMGLAEPGSALVDEVTAAAVDGQFGFSPPMDLDVKGRATPLRVRAYTPGDIAAPISLGAAHSPFVNRFDELDQLRQLSDEAVAGRGSACNVVGSAGVGKTRLIREFVDQGGNATYFLSLPRHRRSAGTDKLAPLFRWLLGLSDDERPTSSTIDRLLDIAGWDRSREQYLRVLVDTARSDTPDGAPASNDSELLRSMAVDLVRRRATESPVTLVIDGADGLQGLALAVVEDIARAAPDLPLLLVLIGRNPVDSPSDSSIDLGDLGSDDAITLASSLGEADPSALIDQVGGNPLAIELAQGSGADDLRLTALIGARIESSGEQVATWVREAAVFGEHLPLASVAEVAGTVPSELFASGLLRTDISGEWARFESDLTREVAYASLTGTRRKVLHHAAGSVLEARLDRDDPVTPAMVADHFSQTDDADRQQVSFRRAGTAAAAAFDLEDAVWWFEQLAPLLHGGEQREVALSLGGWLTTLGEWSRAEHWFEQAMAADEPEVRAFAGLAGIRQAQGRHDEALELLASAEQEARVRGDLEGLAQILIRKSDVTWGDRTPEEIEALIAEMRELAPRVGGELLIRAEHAEATIKWRLQQNSDDARTILRRAIGRAEQLGDRVLLCELHNDLAGTFYVEDRLEEALEALGASRRHARAVGYKRAEATDLANEAAMLIKLGASRQGLRMCRDAALLQVGLGSGRFAAMNLNLAATVYAAVGEDAAAKSLLEALEGIISGQYEGIAEIFMRHHLGRSFLRSGELDRAMAEVRAVDDLAHRLGYHDMDEDQAALEARIVAMTDPIEARRVLDRRIPEPTAVSLYEAWRLDPRQAEPARQALAEAFERTPTARLARRLRAIAPPGPANPREDPDDEVVDHRTFLELAARIKVSLARLRVSPAG